MGIFDKVLSSSESLFKNEIALNYDFIPKLIPYREKQQFVIANCIKPLFSDMNGRNLISFGMPGVGKTVATRKVLNELEEETDYIIPLYVNCWQKNTTYKIFLELCTLLNYKFTHNKRTEELFDVIKTIVNKKSVVFVFDEIDKAEDFGFLYSILEEVYRKSIICITNYKSWIPSIDERIMSRFMPEQIEFLPYNNFEIKGILLERLKLAFVSDVWESGALDRVVELTCELKDLRRGLYLVKEAGFAAQDRSSKKVQLGDVERAVAKMPEFKIKKVEDLDKDVKSILQLIKDNSPSKIGDLYKNYQESGGDASYKTFQRKINKLQANKYVLAKKITGGTEGTTTIISYDTATKQLTDFS